MRHALTALACDWRVTTPTVTARIRGDAFSGQALEAAMGQLRQQDLWQHEEFRAGIAAGLSGYRLSKFQS